MVENSYQNSTIAQILEAIINEGTFEGESHSNIADILLSILNHTEYTKEPKSVIADLLLRVKKKIEGEAFEPYDGPYVSRIAEILLSILNETEYNEAPQSRIAELLLQLKEELEAYTELTASGSIASFITNVVKPLVNGEFTIAAYQEGSGDPSPENIRSIIGYSELNMYKVGSNLFKGVSGESATVSIDYNPVTGEYTLNGTANNNSLFVVLNDYILPSGRYTISAINEEVSDIIIRVRGTDATTLSTLNLDTVNNSKAFITSLKISGYVIRLNRGTTYNNYKFKIKLEVGSTATPYEPYNAEVKTKQLGEEIVGGSYNSATGDKEKTWTKELIKDLDIGYTSQNNYFYILNAKKNGMSNLMSDVLKFDNSTVGSMSNYSLKGNGNNGHIYIKATDYTSVAALKEALGDYHIAYEMIEPIESNIGATPIETFDGANNIFCDTGNSSVTYLYKGTPPESVQRSLSKGPSIDSEEVEIKRIEEEELEKDENILEPDVIEKEDER